MKGIALVGLYVTGLKALELLGSSRETVSRLSSLNFGRREHGRTTGRTVAAHRRVALV